MCIFLCVFFQKKWAVFYFNVNERSLSVVPSNWVQRNERNANISKCWWPSTKSDENLSMMVSDCMEPDCNNWEVHEGTIKGFYLDMEKAHAALEDFRNMSSTSADDTQITKQRDVPNVIPSKDPPKKLPSKQSCDLPSNCEYA